MCAATGHACILLLICMYPPHHMTHPIRGMKQCARLQGGQGFQLRTLVRSPAVIQERAAYKKYKKNKKKLRSPAAIQEIAAYKKFLKVSALVYLLYNVTKKGDFENRGIERDGFVLNKITKKRTFDFFCITIHSHY